MQTSQRRPVFRVIRWLLVVAGLYVALVLYRIPAVMDRQQMQAIVATIYGTPLTADDAAGTHLPPVPDPKKNDATRAGVDANHNGIRDDVELALFQEYPASSSLSIRAAALQYAKALQRYLTDVSNSDTLVAAIQEDERGSFCIRDSIPKPKQTDNDERWDDYFSAGTAQIRAVEDLVLDTPERKERYQAVFKNYMTSYGSLEGEHCDISVPIPKPSAASHPSSALRAPSSPEGRRA